jgi:hypothetical protein
MPHFSPPAGAAGEASSDATAALMYKRQRLLVAGAGAATDFQCEHDQSRRSGGGGSSPRVSLGHDEVRRAQPGLWILAAWGDHHLHDR